MSGSRSGSKVPYWRFADTVAGDGHARSPCQELTTMIPNPAAALDRSSYMAIIIAIIAEVVP